MNILSRDKQIEIIAALTEGLGLPATTRLLAATVSMYVDRSDPHRH